MMKRVKAGMLVDALVSHLRLHGVPDISPQTVALSPVRCSLGGLEIMWCKKARPFKGKKPCQLIDIWVSGGEKVFSASFYPLDVVKFKAGRWADDLLNALWAMEDSA